MSLPFHKNLTVTASTSRLVVNGSGYSNETVPVLDSLLVSEPTPASAEIRSRPVLQTPNELLQTFCDDGYDIQPGDTLTLENSVNVSNKDYPVRAVERWPWRTGKTFKVLVLEDLKVDV